MKVLFVTSLLLFAGCPKKSTGPSDNGIEVRDLAAEAIEEGKGSIAAVPEASAEAGWQMGASTQVLGPLTLAQAEEGFTSVQEKLDMCFSNIPGGNEFAHGLPIRVMVSPTGQVYEAGLRQFLENEGPWVGCVISTLIRMRFPEVESEEPTTIYSDLRLSNRTAAPSPAPAPAPE